VPHISGEGYHLLLALSSSSDSEELKNIRGSTLHYPAVM